MEDNEASLTTKWNENVRKGPVVDKDELWINYIGHPISGAWYYTMARNAGFNEYESFLYSTFISTFMWEYGYEAFAETPSIQDLIVTPIFGSLFGESMFSLERNLDKKKGIIFGSKYLGNLSYFLLNPLGNMSKGMDDFFNIEMSINFEAYNKLNYIEQKEYLRNINNKINNEYYGVLINFNF